MSPLWEELMAQFSSHLPHCSTNKMVNFHDPIVMARESGACAPQAFSQSWKVTGKPEPPFRLNEEVLEFCGWYLYVGLALIAVSMCPMTQFSLVLPSWEFMITLECEWSVIQGHCPYWWTIWVLITFPSSAGPCENSNERQSDLLLDILPYPCSHPRNCGSEYIQHWCSDPNQLSGLCHCIRLRPYSRFLIA